MELKNGIVGHNYSRDQSEPAKAVDTDLINAVYCIQTAVNDRQQEESGDGEV